MLLKAGKHFHKLSVELSGAGLSNCKVHEKVMEEDHFHYF